MYNQTIHSVPIDYKENILQSLPSNNYKYNGRVNILEPENSNARFKMFEKIGIKNKAIEYREATENIWECNVLSQVYFSAENMQIIQNAIRAGVYRLSEGKFVLPNQSVDNLKIIMRSIYLQNARHNRENITGQVEELNKLVLDYCIPFLYGESKAYVKYLEDQSTLVVPLAREVRPDRVYHQLELKPWI
jgi:DNA-binding transcriptional regulator PaaX